MNTKLRTNIINTIKQYIFNLSCTNTFTTSIFIQETSFKPIDLEKSISMLYLEELNDLNLYLQLNSNVNLSQKNESAIREIQTMISASLENLASNNASKRSFPFEAEKYNKNRVKKIKCSHLNEDKVLAVQSLDSLITAVLADKTDTATHLNLDELFAYLQDDCTSLALELPLDRSNHSSVHVVQRSITEGSATLQSPFLGAR